MKFVCKKCGSTDYKIIEKSNGNGIATGLYCAKCGQWQKWLNKQEKALFANDINSTAETENPKAKSLRWVANQIPDFEPETVDDKMLLAFKRYATAGATEIERLEAENAELKARLEKAVELPCKVDTYLYCVHWSQYNPKGGSVSKEYVYKITINDYNKTYTIHTVENGIWTESSFVAIDLGTILFTNRIEAEKRLAELQNHGN